MIDYVKREKSEKNVKNVKDVKGVRNGRTRRLANALVIPAKALSFPRKVWQDSR